MLDRQRLYDLLYGMYPYFRWLTVNVESSVNVVNLDLSFRVDDWIYDIRRTYSMLELEQYRADINESVAGSISKEINEVTK